MPLNDVKIKNLKPKDNPYKVFDGDGLYIYVTTKGVKKWRIKYYYQGKDSIYTIGDYPAVSLRDARMRLFEIKELLSQGKNPALEKKKCIPIVGGTFKNVTLEWMEKQKVKWSEGYRAMVSYRMERYVFPTLADLPIETITAPEVLAIIRKIENLGKTDMSHRLLIIISQAFRYAVACGYCQSDPCRDLRGALAFHKSTPRAAITDPKEAGQLMRNIQSYPLGTVHNALLWSAYTLSSC